MNTLHGDRSSHSSLKQMDAETLPPPLVDSDPVNEIPSLPDAGKPPNKAESNVAYESTEPAEALTTLPQPLLDSYRPVATTSKAAEPMLEKFKSSQPCPEKFRHPFSMLVAGPSSCGKTTWIRSLLKGSMIEPPPRKVFWFYKSWQPLYTDMKITIPNIEFVQGIQPKEADAMYPRLYIFDDLMRDTTKNAEVCEMFTEGSHHRNLSVICLMQNLYFQGKENRTMNLNSQYIVLFKNPRDRQQMAILARQMYPRQ